MSDPFIVVARAEVRLEMREAFVAAARDCIAATRREQGCLAYDMHESVTQPGRFVSYESWETRADIERHMASQHVADFLETTRACVTAAPVIEVIEPRSIDRL